MVNLNKKQCIILIVIFIIILSVIGLYLWKSSTQMDYTSLDIENQNIMENVITEETTKEEDNTIVVHIIGSIKNPGIVKIAEGSRIIDAVDAAGGLLEDADITKVNLAYIIDDGTKIYIPSVNDVNSSEDSEYISTNAGSNNVIDNSNKNSSTKNSSSEMININTATQSELETLSGIGPSTALKIIKYRTENGNFSTIEDIKNVNGIGDAKFESIKDSICVD